MKIRLPVSCALMLIAVLVLGSVSPSLARHFEMTDEPNFPGFFGDPTGGFSGPEDANSSGGGASDYPCIRGTGQSVWSTESMFVAFQEVWGGSGYPFLSFVAQSVRSTYQQLFRPNNGADNSGSAR